MKRIGLTSETFEEDDNLVYNGKKKQFVKLLVNMIMASNLQGCGEAGEGTISMTWTSTTAIMVILILLAIVVRLFLKLTTKMEELEKYKTIWKQFVKQHI